MSAHPILYSFRRCPYAMRARMALWIAGITCELREVKLANKPPELIQASEKATVPVVVLPDGEVLDESLDIMRWALDQNDPEGWLMGVDKGLIDRNDGPFKRHLDRYKYPTRYPEETGGNEEGYRLRHRADGHEILRDLDARLADQNQLCGDTRTMTDIALFPFVRQFANTDRMWFDAQAMPHLQRWLEGHLQSDLFKSIMAKFAVWQSGDEPVAFPA